MLAQSPIPYDKIETLERLLLEQPQVLMPVEHAFCNGLYARTMSVPGGSIITGAIHRSENFLVVRQGRGVIGTLSGLKWYAEGDIFVSRAGAKNFAYIEEDTIFTTFHSNVENDTDPELLWEKYTCAVGELEHEVTLMLEGQ